jgi:hypothetical protein
MVGRHSAPAIVKTARYKPKKLNRSPKMCWPSGIRALALTSKARGNRASTLEGMFFSCDARMHGGL